MKVQVQIEFNRPRLSIHRRFVLFEAVVLTLILALTGALSRTRADSGTCSGQTLTLPFNDVMGNGFFCFIAELYFLGVTAGNGSGGYGPNDAVTRGAMAVFLDRAHDSAVKRSSRRAALNQWWTPQTYHDGMITKLENDDTITDVICDGATLYALFSGKVDRVRASDGAFLDRRSILATTGVVASGKEVCFVGGGTFTVTVRDSSTVFSLPGYSANLTCAAFDGSYIWTGTDTGVIGKTSVDSFSVITVSNSFGTLNGMLFDGSHIWVTETGGTILGHIYQLDSSGNITLTVPTDSTPRRPVYDGANIWVPNYGSNTVTVIRASTGAVLATLSGNGLSGPNAAAFDGERILVTNTTGRSVSLWKAADFSPLGSLPIFLTPTGVCSDGINFWVTGTNIGNSYLLRF